MRPTATGDIANKRVSTSFCSWSRSVRNSALTRWNASDSIASWSLLKTRIIIWVENDETPQVIQNGKSIICTMDNSVLLVVSRLSSKSGGILSSTSRSKDQSNYSRKLGTLQDPAQTRRDKHACGNRCWQIMTIRPRRTVNQQTRCTRKIQRKAFLFGYSPSQ